MRDNPSEIQGQARGKKINFEEIAKDLLINGRSSVENWLPGGRVVGREYVCADLRGGAGGSLSVNLDTGKWADFATGEKGRDLISLYAATKGIKQIEAARELSGITENPRKIQEKSRETYELIKPPPDSRPHMQHKKHGEPSYVWIYVLPSGEPLYYVARYDSPAGKTFLPWSYSSAGKWVQKAWPAPRPVYNLYTLVNQPDKPVLIVEGEKCAVAAHEMLGHLYVVVTWSNGAAAVDKTDWTPLKGRKVLIWPDSDEPGRKAAARVAGIILDQCESVKVIDTGDSRTGWDAADALGEGWTSETFLEWGRPLAKIVEKPVELSDNRAEISEKSPITSDSVNLPSPTSIVVTGQPSLEDVRANLPHVSDKGRPRATIENFRAIIEALGVVIRYNVISKREEVLIPGASFSIDNRGNAAFAWLLSWCNNLQMSVGQLKNFVCYLADTNPYNPVATWIQSVPWDGQTRLPSIYATVNAKNETADPTILRLKEAMIKRWLISAVAAVFRPDGVSAHGVLVFQGAQYLGKTQWFKRLAPHNLEVIADGVILRPDDKDSVKQTVSFWLVELGELDATFRKSDIAQLKSFLTKQKDILRSAYAPTESEFARRTVFFASVNPAQFLHDNTGNRRFWTIECEHIDYEHSINMQQLWAEITELWRSGESWFLTKNEMALLNDHNESFMSVDPVEERIGNDLDWGSEQSVWKWKTATEVLQDIHYERPTQSDLNKASREIVKRNGDQRRRSNQKRLLLVPRAISRVIQFDKQMSLGHE